MLNVDATVLDIAEEADRQVVSVRFRGQVLEERGGTPADFDEARLLGCPLAVPVARVQRIFTDADGRVVYARAYGIADPATGERTRVEHHFRIASISKSVTAVGVGLLSAVLRHRERRPSRAAEAFASAL